VTLYPKLVVHNSWNLKSYWDTTLLEEIQTGFEVWVAEMPLLYEVRISRCLTKWGGGGGSKERWSLHNFCDAGRVAYAAKVSLRPTMGR